MGIGRIARLRMLRPIDEHVEVIMMSLEEYKGRYIS